MFDIVIILEFKNRDKFTENFDKFQVDSVKSLF